MRRQTLIVEDHTDLRNLLAIQLQKMENRVTFATATTVVWLTTVCKMFKNLWWAAGYKVLVFPLAAGALYPFVLSQEVAALSVSSRTLAVAINALMLKCADFAGIKAASTAPAAAGAPA